MKNPVKYLKLIYNPFSGDKSFKFNLDPVIAVFQKAGFEVHIFRSMVEGDIDAHLKSVSRAGLFQYDTIAVSGGDGSVNIVINAMMKYDIKAKLGIIPSGTANDFAAFLHIPSEPDLAARVIAGGKTVKSDLGAANGAYFINVCAAGHFANISQNIDTEFKNTLGKLAYYIKGLEQASGLVSMPLKITNSKAVYEGNFYLFVVLNSAGTGGIVNLVKNADIGDGEFDFIAVREGQFIELASLFINLLKGEHLTDPAALYFRDSYIKIETNGKNINPELLETSLDGERGPDLPVEIKNIKKAITVYVPKSKSGNV